MDEFTGSVMGEDVSVTSDNLAVRALEIPLAGSTSAEEDIAFWNQVGRATQVS